MSSPDLDLFVSDLDELYREVIMDHYRRPRNAQELQAPTIKTHGLNPFCGDESSIQLVLDGQGRVAQVGVQGRGCSISQSSSSLMSVLLKGKTVEEVEGLTELFRRMMQGKDLSEPERLSLGEAGVLEGVRRFPVRIKCALLAWMTLLDGLEEYRAKAKHAPE